MSRAVSWFVTLEGMATSSAKGTSGDTSLGTKKPDSDRISLVVINDAQLVVDGLAAMLSPYDRRLEIVGCEIGVLQPIPATVALVDAFGHPNAGVDRVAEAHALDCFEHVVLFTWKLTPAMAVEAVEKGASGVLSKSANAPELVDGLTRVAKGERVIHDFPVHVWSPTWAETSDTNLTAREIELLGFVAIGLSNAEISQEMYLAESSVKTYLKRVYRKLGISSRAQAVMRAVELGIAGPGASGSQSA